MSLKEEEKKVCVVWTVNLDKKKSRSEGRKIPKRFAVPNVRLSELVEACKLLGIDCIPENKKYPRCWWEEGGRVIIPKTKKKTQIMIELAKAISEIRKKSK